MCLTYTVFVFRIYTATAKLSAHCELQPKKPDIHNGGADETPISTLGTICALWVSRKM